MMIIAHKGLGNSRRGLVLWQNARIFEDKARTSEVLWDTIHFLASFWVSCTTTFKGIPLNVIQLDWVLVCRSKGVG